MTPIENIYICCISPIWWVLTALQTGQPWCCTLMSQLWGGWQGLHRDPCIAPFAHCTGHKHQQESSAAGQYHGSWAALLLSRIHLPNQGVTLFLHPETCTAHQGTWVSPIPRKSATSDPWCCSSQGHVCQGWAHCSYRDFTFQWFSGRAVVHFLGLQRDVTQQLVHFRAAVSGHSNGQPAPGSPAWAERDKVTSRGSSQPQTLPHPESLPLTLSFIFVQYQYESTLFWVGSILLTFCKKKFL